MYMHTYYINVFLGEIDNEVTILEADMTRLRSFQAMVEELQM